MGEHLVEALGPAEALVPRIAEGDGLLVVEHRRRAVGVFNTIIIVLAATGVMSTGVAIASSVTSVVFCLCNYIVFMFVFGVLGRRCARRR